MKKELYRQNKQIMQDAFDRIEVEIHLQKKNNGMKKQPMRFYFSSAVIMIFNKMLP